jgi:histidinol-phosphate/aromatic aminotransferase/cobyric acid decarboxylase-like protein
MPFPLGEWIDSHLDCRHNLAESGMHGTIPTPVPTAAEVRNADENLLRSRLANDLGVDPSRLFLTTGASQANALAMLYVARLRRGATTATCRFCPPEYPPLFDTARWAGFRLTTGADAAEMAVVSQPRNPEGDLWDRSRLLDWASGARSVLVDETFREFAGTPSVVGTDRPGLWASGSFTKFFGGDNLRVGFLVAPEEAASDFARFHGLVTNRLAPFSVAGATRALRERERARTSVLAVLRANVAVARAALPRVRAPQAPVMFDRPETGENGDSLALRALSASVLVCSGSFFADPSGVRLCLTRRSFPDDLAAYLAVRSSSQVGRVPPRATASLRTRSGRPARRPPGGNVRGTTSPS